MEGLHRGVRGRFGRPGERERCEIVRRGCGGPKGGMMKMFV